MPQLGHADELADLVRDQVVEPGEGEGEVLLLDLLDDLLELNSLFMLELMVEHAVIVMTETTEGRSAFSKQQAVRTCLQNTAARQLHSSH